MLFKIKNISDVCSETIDRLIIITHNAEVSVFIAC